MLRYALLFLYLLPLYGQATVLYESEFATGHDGWLTAIAPGYGEQGHIEPVHWDEAGHLRSWSVYPHLWWPDGNHACWFPYGTLDPQVNPAHCTTWLAMVAYRYVDEPQDWREVTVSFRVRMRTSGDPDRIMDGTGEAGAISYGPPLYLWVQTGDANRAYNYVAANHPIHPSHDWQQVTLTLTPGDWQCLGASRYRTALYGCLPAAEALASVTLDWGVILYGIDPRYPPIGSIELDDIVVTVP